MNDFSINDLPLFSMQDKANPPPPPLPHFLAFPFGLEMGEKKNLKKKTLKKIKGSLHRYLLKRRPRRKNYPIHNSKAFSMLHKFRSSVYHNRKFNITVWNNYFYLF
jgi:hypothetical protein